MIVRCFGIRFWPCSNLLYFSHLHMFVSVIIVHPLITLHLHLLDAGFYPLALLPPCRITYRTKTPDDGSDRRKNPLSKDLFFLYSLENTTHVDFASPLGWPRFIFTDVGGWVFFLSLLIYLIFFLGIMTISLIIIGSRHIIICLA